MSQPSTNLAAIIAMKVIVAADGAMTVATKYEDLPQAPGIPLGGLADESEEYIKGKHVRGGNNVTPDKSTFPEVPTSMHWPRPRRNVTARGPNDYGNYEREVDAGHPVGNRSQNNGGQPTNKYKVITDRWGTVINMFPE